MNILKTLVSISAMIFPILASEANAQTDYPNRAITLIVAAPAGGGTDLVSRIVGQQLEAQLGQPVIVDNRPGGAGVVAADYLSREAPDGYTLMVTFDGHTISGVTNKNLNYDPIKSFTPISQLTASGILLTVSPTSPAKDVKSFLEWAKSYQGNLNIGAPAATSPAAVAAQVFVDRAQLNAEVINNQGTSNTLLGVLGGEYQIAFTSIAGALSQVKEGQLRAIGITTDEPSNVLPDVQPVAATFPGYSFENWYGLMAPAGVPDEIVAKLAEETRKAVTASKVKNALENEGSAPVGNTPAEFKAMLEDDMKTWGQFFSAQ